MGRFSSRVVLELLDLYIFFSISTRSALQRGENEKMSDFRKAKGAMSAKEDLHPESNKNVNTMGIQSHTGLSEYRRNSPLQTLDYGFKIETHTCQLESIR